VDVDQRRVLDRRLRLRVVPETTPVAARIRPGHTAEVLNLCTFGALVDTAHRLRPGTFVDLLIETPAYRAHVRARVVHARVSELAADRVRYCGGLAFERALDGLTASIEPAAVADWAELDLQEADPARVFRSR
jgi:hypothetical protein